MLPSPPYPNPSHLDGEGSDSENGGREEKKRMSSGQVDGSQLQADGGHARKTEVGGSGEGPYLTEKMCVS